MYVGSVKTITSGIPGCSLARNTYLADVYEARWVLWSWGPSLILLSLLASCYSGLALWLGARFQSQTMWVQILFRSSLCSPGKLLNLSEPDFLPLCDKTLEALAPRRMQLHDAWTQQLVHCAREVKAGCSWEGQHCCILTSPLLLPIQPQAFPRPSASGPPLI